MAETNGFMSSVQKTFDRPASWYVELAGYLIAGFIAGFLIKHAGRFFFMLLLGAALALWALDYFQIITIHFTILKSLLGLSAETTLNDFMSMWVDWIRSHIIESLIALFGFIIAWKFA